MLTDAASGQSEGGGKGARANVVDRADVLRRGAAEVLRRPSAATWGLARVDPRGPKAAIRLVTHAIACAATACPACGRGDQGRI